MQDLLEDDKIDKVEHTKWSLFVLFAKRTGISLSLFASIVGFAYGLLILANVSHACRHATVWAF